MQQRLIYGGKQMYVHGWLPVTHPMNGDIKKKKKNNDDDDDDVGNC